MIKNIILPLALLATAQAAMAQADPEPENAQLDSIFRHYELEEVVVTGTRTPKFLKDTPIQTRVITSRDIARTDATNVQDLLQQELSGVEFSYSMNQRTHLNFAGFGGQGILFLVDGERLAGESMDDVDFSRLLMAGVERIEIVKGASSALYGSNAAGGVVNIITKNATEPWTLNLNARYAKHNDQRYGGVFALRSKRWSNAFSANYHNKDNYNVTSAANPVTRVISTIYGERTVDFKDKLTWRPSDRLSLGARAGYFFRETTRTVNVPERYRDFSGGLRLDWLISKDDDLQASYAFDQYDKSDYQQLRHLDIRDYSNVQNTFRLLYSHSFGETAMLTAGADYMHDYLYNTYLAGDAREQDCYDVFAQYDWNITDKLEAVAAVRYDYFSDRQNSQLTPKLNLRYKFNHRLVLRAGYGMGFRAPSLKERYYNFDMAGIWIIEGNENLKAEKSHNFTLSAEYTRANCSLAVSAYYNNVIQALYIGALFQVDRRQTAVSAIYQPRQLQGVRWRSGHAGTLAERHLDATHLRLYQGAPAEGQGRQHHKQPVHTGTCPLSERQRRLRPSVHEALRHIRFAQRTRAFGHGECRVQELLRRDRGHGEGGVSCLHHVEALAHAACGQGGEHNYRLGQPLQLSTEALLSQHAAHRRHHVPGRSGCRHR